MVLGALPVGAALVVSALSTAGCSAGSPGETIIYYSSPGGDGGNASGSSGTTGSSGSSGSGGTSSGASSSGASSSGSGSSSSGGSSSSSGSGGSNCVPATVTTALSGCVGCHGNPPVTGALTALVTYADLTKKSALDSSLTEAQESVALMQLTSGGAMPPPSGGAPQSDITALQNWISAGYTGGCGSSSGSSGSGSGSSGSGSGSSGSGSGSSSSGSGSSSSSGSSGSSGSGSSGSGSGSGSSSGSSSGGGVFAGQPPYAIGTQVDGHHNPGQDCMGSCHNHGFTFAGTLYDGSGNPVSGAEVRLVDSTGHGISVYSGIDGNFYSSTPWTASAMVGARNATNTQLMIAPLSSSQGGCNSCHANGGATSPVHLP